MKSNSSQTTSTSAYVSASSSASSSTLSLTNDDGHVMGDWDSLYHIDNVVWAKLRGYPWWPAIVKEASDAPSELVSTAKQHIKAKSSILVYFFGSHDFSLIPIENIRPFWANVDHFSSKKTGSKVKMAIKEAKKYTPSTPKSTYKDDYPEKPELELEPKQEPQQEQIALYCRLKIQRIVFRKKLRKEEAPILEKLIKRLEDGSNLTYRSLIATQISRVIRIALSRDEFMSSPNWSPLRSRMELLLKSWRKEMLDYIYDLGL